MAQAPWILGICASHNGAVCLLKGSDVAVAIQEERLVRRKRQRIFAAQPARSIAYCLDHAGIQAKDLALVALSVQGSFGAASQDLLANPLLQIGWWGTPVLRVPHHLAHAASAFGTSGFEEAGVLVIDGSGSPVHDLPDAERRCIVNPAASGAEAASLYSARGAAIAPLEKHLTTGPAWLEGERDRMPRFHSIGGMYSAVASQIFGDVHASGQVMGLAPLGRIAYPVDDFLGIVDGRFLFSEKVPSQFRTPARWPQCETAYRDLARSVQAALEVAVLHLANRLRQAGFESLCYAGGVALNSIANERIIRECGFRDVRIVPAAEDSGCVLGAAYMGLWQLTGRNERRRMRTDAMGRRYTRAEVEAAVAAAPAVEAIASADVPSDTARLLAAGGIVGWFSGGSELGPRALGQRSILCDPRPATAKDRLNARVKKREAFRPFAPAVPLEKASGWFELGPQDESSYMLRVCEVRAQRRDLIPAVVHADRTVRVQTVSRQENPPFHALLSAFGERTGVPVLLNTSFNVMGMPIVESPADALACMLSTEIDYCVLEHLIVRKRPTVLVPPHLQANAEWPVPASRLPELASQGAATHSLAGMYEGSVGRVEIEAASTDRLVARWAGQSMLLVRVLDNTFQVAQGDLRGCRLLFAVDAHGVAGRAVLERPGEADLEFARQHDGAGGPVGTQLAAGAGDYCLEDCRLTVRIGADGPEITGPGLPAYRLQPCEGGAFALVNTPGYAIAFATQAGRALVVKQPNGCYRLDSVPAYTLSQAVGAAAVSAPMAPKGMQ